MSPRARCVTQPEPGRVFRALLYRQVGDARPRHAYNGCSGGQLPAPRSSARNMLRWIDDLFSDGRQSASRELTHLSDIALYQRLWWLKQLDGKVAHALTPYGAIQEWMRRISGHGRDDESGDAALSDNLTGLMRAAFGRPAQYLDRIHFLSRGVLLQADRQGSNLQEMVQLSSQLLQGGWPHIISTANSSFPSMNLRLAFSLEPPTHS